MSGKNIDVAAALKKASAGISGEGLASKLNASGIYYPKDPSRLTVKETVAERKEYDNRDETALRKEATEYADKKYASKVGSALATAERKINDYNVKLKTSEIKKEEETAALDAEYERELTDVLEKAIKNGTVTSSAFTELLNTAQKTYERQKSLLEREYEVQKEGLQTQITITEEQKNAALREYDLQKAEAYEKRLDELKQEQADYNSKVAEYNRRMQEYEDNYAENRKRTLEEWKRAIEEGKL